MKEPPHMAEILLVEDDPDDIRFLQERLQKSKIANAVHVASNGLEAMAYLRREGPYAKARRPDLVFLDLNLPKMDGREVLAQCKADPQLKSIPIVILTASAQEEDILKAYNLQASCYVTKPVDLDQFARVVAAIDDFWLGVVKLPSSKQ